MNADRVYSIGYRPITDRGHRQPPAWAIARTMLTLAWRQRATKMVLLLCLAVVGFHGVWLVGQLLFERFSGAQGGLGGAVEVSALVGQAQEVLASFLRAQFFTTAIALAVIAGGCVAEDRAAGAFDLYFARPLTRRDYAFGKLWGAGLVPTATIVGPVLLLWLTALGIATPALRAELWWMAVPALGGGVLGAAVLTSTLVGLSSIGQKGRTVAVAYVAGLVVLSGIFEGLAAAGYDVAGYLAPERDLRTVIDWLLEPQQSFAGQLGGGRAGPINGSALGSVIGLCGYITAGLALLAARLRAEVVG